MPKQPKSLGQLARQISGWTSNSLITVMLLVIAMGFGREVLHWWHEEQAPPPSLPPDPLGDRAGEHILEFGDQAWSIRRQEFSGSPASLPAALQQACRTAIVDAQPRGEKADAAEQDLLKRLAREKPVAEEQGRWRLYEWGAGHPLLIGTRAIGWHAPDESGRAEADPRAPRTNLAETAYRVVIWGVAVPAAADAWTVYLFQSGGPAGAAGQGQDEIPIPPGGHRLLAIRAVAGGAITAFTADDGLAARKFYDRWFADHGWTAARAWRQIAAGWHAGFEQRSSTSVRAIDIRLGIDLQGRWSGLLLESQLERGKP